MALSATPTKADGVFGGIQFVLLVLAVVAGLPFLCLLFAVGFTWKLWDELRKGSNGNLRE
jgi:hypothetical protein